MYVCMLGIGLRGQVVAGTVLCFFPGTVVSCQSPPANPGVYVYIPGVYVYIPVLIEPQYSKLS